MTPQCLSKSQIKRAGRILAQEDAPSSDDRWARSVTEQWRSAHKEVLEEMEGMLWDVVPQVIDPTHDAIIVSRLKRLDTIIGKLRRPTLAMKLNEMNDIAGCRVIVPSLDTAYAVFDALKGQVPLKPTHGIKDYIETPKPDGYRSIHLITKHDARQAGLTGLFCETQIRTQLQHAWSTALETYDVVRGQGMKFGGGTSVEKRFFALTSTLLAQSEGAPTVSGIRLSLDETKEAIRLLERKSHILEMLRACSGSVTISSDDHLASVAYFVLDIDYEMQCTKLYAYPIEKADEAERLYAAKEQEKGDYQDVLLVRARSLQNLRAAYPNYSMDIRYFLDTIDGLMGTSR